eukprot:scaffold15391_cov146-Isochrysis_galbana.AAC.2
MHRKKDNLPGLPANYSEREADRLHMLRLGIGRITAESEPSGCSHAQLTCTQMTCLRRHDASLGAAVAALAPPVSRQQRNPHEG